MLVMKTTLTLSRIISRRISSRSSATCPMVRFLLVSALSFIAVRVCMLGRKSAPVISDRGADVFGVSRAIGVRILLVWR